MALISSRLGSDWLLVRCLILEQVADSDLELVLQRELVEVRQASDYLQAVAEQRSFPGEIHPEA